MTNLLQSKAKNILAIVFSSVYAFTVFLNFNFNLALYGSWRYIINSIFTNSISLLLPVAIIVFIALKNNQGAFKKLLLPIVFGVVLTKGTYTLFMSFANTFTVLNRDIEPLLLITLFLSCLSFAAVVLMFVGTLGSFKNIALLKYGALASAIILALIFLLSFILAGGFTYFETISDSEISTPLLWFNQIKSWLRFLSQILFYIGLFILFPAKKREKEEITA